ncbi:MAG: PAS domain-containing protein, partial [Planctomycetes bacterium]|nr:PAS domain-containing protein [Planctomycetota bacterium]
MSDRPDNNLTSSELKAVLDAAGTMIIATDLNGTIKIFNPAAERMLGWRAAEVVDQHTPALWHDGDEVAARAAELSRELGRRVVPGFE